MITGPVRSAKQQLALLEALELDCRPVVLQAGECFRCHPFKLVEDLCFFYGELYQPKHVYEESTFSFRCPVAYCSGAIHYRELQGGGYHFMGACPHSCSVDARRAAPLPLSLRDRLIHLLRNETLPNKEMEVDGFVENVLEKKYGLYMRQNLRSALVDMLPPVEDEEAGNPTQETQAMVTDRQSGVREQEATAVEEEPPIKAASTKEEATAATDTRADIETQELSVEDFMLQGASWSGTKARTTADSDDAGQESSAPDAASPEAPPTKDDAHIAAPIPNFVDAELYAGYSAAERGEWNGCVCGKRHLKSVRKFWLGCDACDAWYEVIPKCIKMNAQQAKDRDWKCPACVTLSSTQNSTSKAQAQAPSRQDKDDDTLLPVHKQSDAQSSPAKSSQTVGLGVASTPIEMVAWRAPRAKRVTPTRSSEKKKLESVAGFLTDTFLERKRLTRTTAAERTLSSTSSRRTKRQKVTAIAGKSIATRSINEGHMEVQNNFGASGSLRPPRKGTKTGRKWRQTEAAQRVAVATNADCVGSKQTTSLSEKNISLARRIIAREETQDPADALENYAVTCPPKNDLDKLLFEYEANAAMDLVAQLDFGHDAAFTKKATLTRLQALDGDLEENYPGLLALLEDYTRNTMGLEGKKWQKGSNYRREQVRLGDHEEALREHNSPSQSEVADSEGEGALPVEIIVNKGSSAKFNPPPRVVVNSLYDMSRRAVNVSVLSGASDLVCIIDKALKFFKTKNMDSRTLAPLYRARQLVTTKRKRLHLEKVWRARMLLRRIANRVDMLRN